MKNCLIVLACYFFSSSAFAFTYVKCGEKVLSPDDGIIVKNYELEISSANDEYSGPVGGNWSLKLEEDSEWNSVFGNITAEKYIDEDEKTVVKITKVSGQSISGPVTTVYKIIDLYSESPGLEKYIQGGFAGNQSFGPFECAGGSN